MSPKIKNIIMFVLIGGSLTASYVLFFGGDTEETQIIEQPGTQIIPGDGMGMGNGVGMVPGGVNSSGAVSDFLPVLLNVKGIRLDDSIFVDPAFSTLRDSSILLVPDGTEGRKNPFAPIGFESISSVINSFENDISPAPNQSPSTPFSLTPTTNTKNTNTVSTPKSPNN